MGKLGHAVDLAVREAWHPQQIVGRKVALRRPEPGDLAAVTRWYRDPEIARLTRYQTRRMTETEIEVILERAKELHPEAKPQSSQTARHSSLPRTSRSATGTCR